jgi:hypothetical protein
MRDSAVEITLELRSCGIECFINREQLQGFALRLETG